MPRGTALTIRAYNVRFGDCVLVSVPSDDGEKHLLIDFGNAPSMVKAEGGLNDVFAPDAANIKKRTGGRLDLVIMSHEHLDHMEGFRAEKKVFDTMEVGEVWMPAMSAPNYYERFPDCEPLQRARLALVNLVESWKRVRRIAMLPQPFDAIIANNVLALSNLDRIDYLRSLPASPKRVKYEYRRNGLERKHPLGDRVRLEVLAPERRASVYYGEAGSRLWLQLAAAASAAPGQLVGGGRQTRKTPPRHVAVDEYENLRDAVAELDYGSLLAIDKAANNTSLVVRMTVDDKTLLFPGDAEQESWAMMSAKGLLKPVDFLKVSHHGSANGMPFEGDASVVDLLLKPRKRTVALVSTWRGAYGDSEETAIPNPDLLELLNTQCKKVWDTQNHAKPGEYVEFEL